MTRVRTTLTIDEALCLLSAVTPAALRAPEVRVAAEKLEMGILTAAMADIDELQAAHEKVRLRTMDLTPAGGRKL